MATKKNKEIKRQESLGKKNAIQSIEFLTSFGLKQMGAEDSIYASAKAELKEIIQLEIYNDILDIKKLTDGVKQHLNAKVCSKKGELNDSYVCLALGISCIDEIHNQSLPSRTWEERLKQKILSIYYSDDVRNKVVALAKENGFNTSLYFGQPVIKFSKIFLLIKRTMQEE